MDVNQRSIKSIMLCSHFAVKRLRSILPSVAKRFLEDYPSRFVGEALWLEDILREDLVFISESLGQPYLAETKDEPKFPVSGLVYSATNGRRCVNLIVERGKKKIYVPFIIDSGSPTNLISEDALAALGLTDYIPKQLNVTLHGFKSITLNYSADNKKLKDINLLGYQFFQVTKTYESFNAESMELTLHKSMAEFLKTVSTQK